MNHLKTKIISTIAFIFFTVGCEKEITVDLPDAQEKIVIEGRIEQGMPPYIMLTKSSGYFEPTSKSVLEQLYIHDAKVFVKEGNNTFPLTEQCIEINNFKYCVYTTASLLGEVGKTYDLEVVVDDVTLTATTTIPPLVPLDSIWFKREGNDSLGFIWAHLIDPAAQENSYRWFAKRINKDTNGMAKDETFYPPMGSAFDDQFFNGLSFNFAYNRGAPLHSTREEDNNEESGYFKTGDTVVIKFCTIDKGAFKFIRSFETVTMSAGNPFASPTSVQSNIKGDGLGIWGGYGVTCDTIIALK